MAGRVGCGILAGCIGLALAVSPVTAEPVTLTTVDGTFSVSGEIRSFDGTTFLIDTVVGEVSVEAAAVTCSGAGCPVTEPPGGQIRVAGDGALLSGSFGALVAGFAEASGGAVEALESETGEPVLRISGGDHPLDVTLRAAGSAAAIDALFKGEANLALSTRPVLEQEAQAFAEFGLGDLSDPALRQVIARDAVVALVHPANPVEALSAEELGLVLAGRIGNWSDLGGPDARIVLYRRQDGSGAEDAARAALLGPGGGAAPPASAVPVPDDAALAAAVAADPNGIAVASLAAAGDLRPLGIETGCGGHVLPTPFAVGAGHYPLDFTLFLYASNRPLDTQAEAFRAWLASSSPPAGGARGAAAAEPLAGQAQRLVAGILAARTPTAFAALREAVERLADYRQLPFVLRPGEGGAAPSGADPEVAALATALSAPELAGREVLLAGFAAGTGAPSEDREAGEALAAAALDAVRAAVPALAEAPVTATGFGALYPLDCEGAGAAPGARVEAWVRDPG